MKSIKTATHTNLVVQLLDLVTDDTNSPGGKSWRNGEASQVESEFDLLQQEFGATGSHHGTGSNKIMNVTNAAEALPVGDEIVTRRYEFYAYVGPTDPTTHEALATKVGLDGRDGINQYSNTVVVGEYLGAQMSSYKNVLPIGLTENIADGKLSTVYPTRTIVISGTPFTCTNTGTLPDGMTFDIKLGQISGVPTETGVFSFKVRVSATNQPAIEHAYTFAITDPNELLPPHSTVDTVSYPLDSGDICGLGLYTNGDACTVTAVAKPGYRFSKWTDDDVAVSSNAVYQFPVSLNRSLVASFVPAPPDLHILRMSANSHALEWPTNPTPCLLEETLDFTSTNWSVVNAPVSVIGTNAHAEVSMQSGARFYRIRLQ